ncbi:MAG: BREX system P-loop protein BrxC, partial [Bryobacteraceae bacterium]
ALNAAHNAHDTAFQDAMAKLAADGVWNKITPADQARILREVGLEAPVKPDLGSDAALVAALDSKGLAARRTEAEAIPARVDKALQQAAQILEPKVQFVAVDRALLKSEADVDSWLAGQRRKLVAALQNGPVQVQ